MSIKIKLILLILITALLFTACEGLLMGGDPISRINPEDPETSLTITGDSEINICIGNDNFLTGSTYTFETDTEIYQSQEITFTIENLSSDTVLRLTGTPIIAVSGTNSPSFSLGTMPPSTIASDSSINFIISFNPAATGVKTATLTIGNNDPSEASYTIKIEATAIASTSVTGEISVEQSSTEIETNGSYAFSAISIGANNDAVFTIKNLNASAALGLTGSTPVTFTGAHAADFSVISQPSGSIAASSNTLFTVRFVPEAIGTRTAVMQIASNDSNENPYIINLSGEGTAITGNSEIHIKQDTINFASGDTFSFAAADEFETLDAEFTIFNQSSDTALTVTSAVLSGTNADQFSLTQPVSPVAFGSSSTFTVTFEPTSEGAKTALITITNDDPNEGTYIINFSGTGLLTYGEIHLTQDSTDIVSGGDYTFSDTAAGEFEDIVFTITNQNTDKALNFTGTPIVAITGTNADQFNIEEQPVSPVAADGTDTFTVRFEPTSLGAKNAVIEIQSDDEDEGTYTINISGEGTLDGTPLDDNYFSQAQTVITNNYLAPRTAGDTAIEVDGDITISAGSKLTIYEGVTLDMGTFEIIVQDGGELVIVGSDAQRVKLTSSDSLWEGIMSFGNVNINGAYIENVNGTSSRCIQVGNSTTDGGDLTITNSRIYHTSTSKGLYIYGTRNGASFVIENNIIAYTSTSGNPNAIHFYSYIENNLTAVIRYNTIIGKGSSGYAIYISDTNGSSRYTIEGNIIANRLSNYIAGIYFGSTAHMSTVQLNIIDNGIDPLLQGTADTFEDNHSLGWDNNFIFQNFDANDYRMSNSVGYPNLTAAGDIEELVGALSSEETNQIGAYGNEGYPPLPY